MGELKFKVFDKIREIGKDDTPLTVLNINQAMNCYICDQNVVIYFRDQDRWETVEEPNIKNPVPISVIERTVTIDAGGYPKIDISSIELYDYQEDKPLAKEGDKIKIIIIRE